MIDYTLAGRLRKFLEALDSDDAPDDCGCTHLGLNFRHGPYSVGVNARGSGRLLVTVYADCERRSKRRWDRLVLDIADRAVGAPVSCRWNGGEGLSGVSAVYDVEPPRGLLKLLNARVPNGGYDFWLRRRLEEVGFPREPRYRRIAQDPAVRFRRRTLDNLRNAESHMAERLAELSSKAADVGDGDLAYRFARASAVLRGGAVRDA